MCLVLHRVALQQAYYNEGAASLQMPAGGSCFVFRAHSRRDCLLQRPAGVEDASCVLEVGEDQFMA